MTMDKTRILSGDLLVTKGALKLGSSLPEVGLKDVSPNGSWLEQKQIQAALEARKHLIEIERIEKSGVLSHAEWREELMLAEVTQKTGSYWQYFGHNVGNRLFLKPEEALYLIETNCLLLKYNEVKVSLQQAYALMLRSKIALMNYKVYASLSRLGYRVFRHRIQLEPVPKDVNKNIRNIPNLKTVADDVNCENDDSIPGIDFIPIVTDVNTDQSAKDLIDKNVTDAELDNTKPETSKTESDISNLNKSDNLNKSVEAIQTAPDIEASTSENLKKDVAKIDKHKNSKYIQYKINKLKRRKYKTKERNNTHNDFFGNIPEFTKSPVINVKAPDRRYLPDKVYLRNKTYYLSLERIRKKSTGSEEIPTTVNTSNGSNNTVFPNNLNNLRHPPPHSYTGSNWTEYFNFRISSQSNPFRHFNFWRPQTGLNYFHFNMTFQRPFLYPQFGQRVMFNPFLPQFMASNINEDVNLSSNNTTNRKKRARDNLKQEHYASIQRLANYVKNSILELRLSDHHVTKLNHLIQTYNTRYKTRLRLSPDFTIMVDENIIDMIEVDDDEEQVPKRAKRVENPDAFNDNLQRLQQLASQLKKLEIKNESTSRHRRMFSQLLKKFNQSYNVDYNLNTNFDVINRNDLTALSSSDVEETPQTTSKVTRRKKLKNPFSILKQLSEKHVEEKNFPSTSSTNDNPFRYSEITVNTFKKDWLPDQSDFGRAEIVSKDFANEVIDSRREQFLFDFMKIQPDQFKNWLDIKISFLQCLQKTCDLFKYDECKNALGLESLVKPDEFNDSSLVLKKLSIFENYKTVNEDSNLTVDFDVYNRNVQNFKKSNRPSPHFRVVCIKESSTMPSGEDLASLHAKYKDNITIIFAVVGVASISYLQVNPVDLAVYKSNNHNTVQS